MNNKCTSYGSSWCADFECKDCPVLDTEEQPNKAQQVSVPEGKLREEIARFLYHCWREDKEDKFILWNDRFQLRANQILSLIRQTKRES